MNSKQPGLQQKFNNDLLIGESDIEQAKLLFPRVLPLLDYPKLKERFSAYDRLANRARLIVRSLGFMGVFGATVALLAIVTKDLWPRDPGGAEPSRWLGLSIEVAGMIAAIIAVGGLWLGPWKTAWLTSRLMTERMRQWHFQLFVRRGQEVEKGLRTPVGLEAFKQQREVWFAKFISEYENNPGGKLRGFIADQHHPETWLHPKGPAYTAGSTESADVFEALQHLRFNHQYNYASYKLQNTTDKNFWAFLRWPEPLQLRIFEGGANFCFGFALILSMLLVVGHVRPMAPAIVQTLNALAIGVALLGAALHSLQDGLALEQEVERYHGYLAQTGQLAVRFQEADHAREKLALMEELELAAAEEMRGFLRSQRKAKFVL
jgi:hypothetical protein